MGQQGLHRQDMGEPQNFLCGKVQQAHTKAGHHCSSNRFPSIQCYDGGIKCTGTLGHSSNN
eukprot:14136789-Ditylum_brightwellii.AAC.1